MTLEEQAVDLHIRDIVAELGIPEPFVEDAVQEGWVAHLEKRDIRRALIYWWETEHDYMTRKKSK
jgi:hypothetical protein